MKKILTIFVIFLSVFLITGCNASTSTKKSKQGKIYERISLKDGNVTVFEGIVPKGWNYNIESNWNVVSSVTPGKETVYLSSPDLSATIKIISQESFTENKKYQEGENTDYYTTYLHYMNASDYLDYYMDKYYKGSKLVKDVGVDEKLLTQIKDYNNIIYTSGLSDVNAINSQGKVKVSLSIYESTASKKQYELGLNNMEVSTAIAATKTTLESPISPLLNSESILSKIPYTIVYTGETKEAFDKYYDEYLFIVANSNFTKDYYAMVEYVSNAITNAYTSYYTEKSKAGLQAWNNYVDSNYSSTSSASTNEKVMEMWDDVIKEVDSYKLEDGTQFKTSIHNETVAQNGNEIYVGTKAGIPNGFQIVDKSY